MSTSATDTLTDTGEKHKLAGLDHLRAFAIIFVILFHYQFFGHPEWERGMFSAFGWTGVDLFFVLSGFLISGQLFGAVARAKAVPLREFFIKRFFRIIPPYLVVLALYFCVPGTHEWGRLPPVWRYLTFTLNFGLNLSKYGTFSHAWSLCIEEQFYLLLPLAFWVFDYFKRGKKAGYLIAALFIAGFMARFLSWHYLTGPYTAAGNFGMLWNKYIYYPTYNRLDALLTGVSIAGVFTFLPGLKDLANRHCHKLLLAGLILLAGAFWMCSPQDNFYTCVLGFPLIAIAYGTILAAAVCPACILYRQRSWVTSQIAALSYSIYLSHKIVIHLVQKALGNAGMDVNSGWVMMICMVCVVLAGLVMRYAIEKPALKVRDLVLAKLKN